MDVGLPIISTAILLLFVLDPFGNVPVLLSVLKDVPEDRVRKVIVREMGYGLIILLGFLFLGDHFLSLFHLQTESVTIAGAIIFFIIGIRLIFPSEGGGNIYGSTGEPFMVPIAIPMIAGPSALATLLVLSRSNQGSWLETLAALLLAWLVTSVVLIFSPLLYRILKDKGLEALERLMGMLLLIMAVQMGIDGLRGLQL